MRPASPVSSVSFLVVAALSAFLAGRRGSRSPSRRARAPSMPGRPQAGAAAMGAKASPPGGLEGVALRSVESEAVALVGVVDRATEEAIEDGVEEYDTMMIARYIDRPGLIGAGADRIVFVSVVDPSVIIKITNPFRRSANLDEAYAWGSAGHSARTMLVPVHDYASDGSWLIMPRVRPWDKKRQGQADRSRFEALGFWDIREQNLAEDGRLLDYAEPVDLRGSAAVGGC